MSSPRLRVTGISQERAIFDPAAPMVWRATPGPAHLDVPGVREASVDFLDDLFNADVDVYQGWSDRLLSRLEASAINGRVTYVVPGHPLLGDHTVQHLGTLEAGSNLTLEISDDPFPDTLTELLAPQWGPLGFVDALTLIGIEQDAPFAGGMLPLNTNQTVVITNVSGRTQIPDLVQILSRRYRPETEVVLSPMHGKPARVESSLIEISDYVDSSSWYLLIPASLGDEFQRGADDLQRLVARLRAPDGCPWDREQTHQTLTRNLIEESYELLDAIESDNSAAIREELGDFLLQAYLHCQIGEEDGTFTLEDVFATLIDKLVRRHPHVFASTSAKDSDAVVQNWDAIKRAERAERVQEHEPGPLGDVPASLPALMRAQSLVKRARRYGLDAGAMQQHRARAIESVTMSNEQAELIGALLGTADAAAATGIDLEALLRNWTRAFEESVSHAR